MRRGTTPARALTIEGIDLTGYSYEVAIKQGTVLIIKEDKDCDLSVTAEGETPTSTINFSLTQEETLRLSAKGEVKLQVRYIDEGGIAGATSIATESVSGILRDGVINYA